MDLPILRYVDIVIGLAVVVLLACTVVTAITQLILSSAYLRARNLRDALSDLIAQVDPNTLRLHSRYLAERLLRHPLVARDNTVFGGLAWHVRAWWRKYRNKMPLPDLNPPDTIQREEVIMLLLDWAGDDGVLRAQDQELAARKQLTPAHEERIDAARDAVRAALRKTGIGDPAAIAAAIRKRMILNECEHPEQPATLWRSQAITEVATTDFAGKIHAWYDNTMTRATESYAFYAQVLASAIALAVAFAVQLDSINLIHRLATDDKLRASLVAEAEMQIKRHEEAQKNQDSAQAQDAKAQREQIAAALADLRDPKRGVTPSYLAWQAVAQTRVCASWMPTRPAGAPPARLRIVAGADERRFTLVLRSTAAVDELAAAVRQTGSPVTGYHAGDCAVFVAQNADVDKIEIFEEGATADITAPTVRAADTIGLGERFPGVLLSWILISLGAPFWYDLLKKLVGFRSILAQKDEKERAFRNNEQTTLPAGAASQATSTPGAQSGTTQEGDDERGDLQATGAEG